MTVLTELAAGHVFAPTSLHVSAEAARAYRDAADDSLALYDELGLVPPLCVAALALGVLLESVSLPPGSLHANESLQFLSPVPYGSTLECRAVLAQHSQRSSWIVSVLDSEIVLDGRMVLTGRVTVLSPASPS